MMKNKTIKIGDKTIGPDEPVFIIAEVGNNHNGSFDRAKEMIDMAREMGVGSVKFQMRDMDELYRKRTLKREGEDLSTEYVLDLLDKFQLTKDEHKALKDYCDEIGILYLCTPWDKKSIAVLEEWDLPAYKVASADLTNIPLLEELIKTKKPLILSTGMCHEHEIKKTVDFLNKHDTSYVLLHCNSTYPAPFKNIQLNYLQRLKEIHSFVGYSGHERGTSVTLGAVALGAQVVERHFTLDRNMEGPDHAASLEFKDFQFLVQETRVMEEALGRAGEKVLGQGEMMNRETLGKSLVASHSLEIGHVITREDIVVKGPGQGLSPQRIDELVGTTLTRVLKEEDYFFPSDLSTSEDVQKDFSFKRPWGIPVRYHDFLTFQKQIRPDLYEFHLSYTDLKLKPEDYLSGPYEMDFVVHAPELFDKSMLLDLASFDQAYLNSSLACMKEVIELTKNLKKYFPKTKKPLIVTNIGGFTRDKKLTESQVAAAYNIFAESLQKLDLSEVELIPQTMAPFPWHFGGQRYQNLFVMPDETAQMCQKLGLRICLDVSHSQLTSNHYGLEIEEFIKIVGPYVAHIHISDASGHDGEGLQMGQGTMNFDSVCEALTKYAPTASFIPEVWQGHKNNGEGFWHGLKMINGKF